MRFPKIRRSIDLAIPGAVGLGVLLAGSVARAQEDPLAQPAPSWRITLKPGVWAPSLAGDLQLPGGASSARVERFNVDSIQPTALGRWEFRRGKLTINGSGFGFTLDKRTTPDANLNLGGLSFPKGDAVNAEFDLLSVEMTAGWRVWERTLTPNEDGKTVVIGVDAYGGLRAYHMNTSFGMIGGATRGSDNTFFEPIVGGRLTVAILDNFGFFVALDGGGMPIGNHTSTSFDIITGIHWRPWPDVGFEFGWRQLSVDLQDGSGAQKTEFNGELAGIIGSLVIRF